MPESPVILNEREARRTRSLLARIDDNRSADFIADPERYRVPADVWDLHERALQATRRISQAMLDAYEAVRSGDSDGLSLKWRHDPGVLLIIARIARNMSQSELAQRLNLREQQIQRYESERYRSISLQAFRRIAGVLGVQIEARIVEGLDASLIALKSPPKTEIDDRQMKAIALHARRSGWFDTPDDEVAARQKILDFIDESSASLGSPGLLRTGLRSLDLQDDAMLAAWRARILQRAERSAKEISGVFDQVNLSWVANLVRLSIYDDGPSRAVEWCKTNGVLVLIEPQITGLKLDGAAFLLGSTPVIGLTIRQDRLDNFWFTLLHEIGHTILHYNAGLASGFFDEETDLKAVDELELEADQFASSMLIPPERWRQSTVRVTRSAASVDQFARQLEINPAIVFGRIRRERNDYKLFYDRVGAGQVRQRLISM